MSRPPHDLAAERAVLGAVVSDPAALRAVDRLVAPEDFYDPSHATIFMAMQALATRGVPIDPVTLAAELRQRERLEAIGGAQALAALAPAPAPPAHVEAHAQIVSDLGRTRRALAEIADATTRLQQGEALATVHRRLTEALAQQARRATGESITEGLAALYDDWHRPHAHVATGLWQLDALLAGGLRAGDLIGIAGSAGGGKSLLAGQIALDAAKAGAVVVYASVEMPHAELLARWLALEAFRAAAPHGDEWALGYSDLRYGRAWHGDGLADPAQHQRVLARIEQARAALATVDRRLAVHQVAPGATVADLRGLVATTHAPAPRARAARPTVLVVDPLQRLFASACGGRTGRAAAAINATETERVGAVAQELKYLADTEGLAILFTSDTTKAAALGAVSSAGSLRGSYQLNHLATVVLGLHTGATPEALRARLDGEKERDAIAPDWPLARLQQAMPAALHARRDAQRLGARAALLECSKNRRGPAHSLAVGLVPGAACVLEGEPDAPAEASSGAPRARGKGRP
jgi:predicted ATP-dependent serine protease